MATACSAPTSSTIAAMSRWETLGTTSTSLRSGARRSGRTRRRATPRLRRTSGGSGTTNQTRPTKIDPAWCHSRPPGPPRRNPIRKRNNNLMATKTNVAEAVVIERAFNAPVGRAWKALTDVEEMRQWNFDLKEFKPEVGFEFEFVVEHEGNTYHQLCKVTEVIPEQKIAYTWRYKGEPGNSLVTFELLPDGDKTKLRVTYEGLETFPKTPAYARKNFEAGWKGIASELEKCLQ